MFPVHFYNSSISNRRFFNNIFSWLRHIYFSHFLASIVFSVAFASNPDYFILLLLPPLVFHFPYFA